MTTYEPAPAGEIEVEIIAASIGDVAWKASPENERGACLRLRLSAGRRYGYVFEDVPLDWHQMLGKVRAAVGLASDSVVPAELVGRRARVVLKHYTAKNGSVRATVAKWLPPAHAATPTPARPSDVPCKVSRNAPACHGTDDIPF